ncbi:sulfatase-like hydrolase/transferase [Devosia algicola]|uniref:Sulfatase-like hydrolase/transferase n=1 Tax=Devosia algicola TaxID=3026418 RepID=A0ABY7YS01_9HYPH|nr:sulfatase/phosphatase domain-containing protein [Devosia algicola]WDR03967.1 sulfatase-like hydrolase/transferase [Devosia algicola]
MASLMFVGGRNRKVPDVPEGGELRLVDALSGKNFVFTDSAELAQFKYQRYIKRYLRTVASIDESVGRLLDYLDESGLAQNTIVIYTSDQGFFLGEHGWFDKRFMYEESLKMPFLIRYPEAIKPGSTSQKIATNVDFAPTFLDYAGVRVPTYMQGRTMRPVLESTARDEWENLAYHRYWMHKDIIHNAFAHYGVRNERYKLIYWYNDPLEQLGATDGSEPPEWELFDCEDDPFELNNLAHDPQHRQIFETMLGLLDSKMDEIGDLAEHDTRAVLAS